MNLKEILPKIKPFGKDENGKYNRKLYNLLKNISGNEYQNKQLRIYFYSSSRWSGKDLIFNPNIHKDESILSQIIISPYGTTGSGHFLSEVIRKNNPEHWSLCLYDPKKFTDVTEWFFDNYIRIGRCLFDKYHHDFDNEYNNRYYIINKNHRKCRWCGGHFHREFFKKVEIKKYSSWESSNKKEKNEYAKV